MGGHGDERQGGIHHVHHHGEVREVWRERHISTWEAREERETREAWEV